MSEQIRKVAADFNTSLSTKVEVAGTTFTLSSATDDDSVVLADGDYCFTVNNESSNKEYFVGTLDGSTKIVTAVKTITRQGAESSGAAREHRVGSPVIISDFAGLRDVVETLRGAKDLDADNPLQYDTTAAISDAKMLATKAYVDAVVNGGSVFYETQILRANAGETVTDGALVYLKESDGEWYLVDTSTKTDWANEKIGIAQGAGTDGASIAGGGVLRSGMDDTISYTAGQLYYGTDVAGVIGTSAGTEELIIGVGDANNKLVFFNDPYQLTDDEKDALAGGGSLGTPSSTNKYMTEDGGAAKKFGGDGSDGALDTSSGTVNIDASNANVVIKNYSSVNIVTNNLTMTNPSTTGTLLIIKCQGLFLCSAEITMTGMGAAGGLNNADGGAAFNYFVDGTNTPYGQDGTTRTGGTSVPAHYTNNTWQLQLNEGVKMLVGSGGGGAENGSSVGGIGGGALYIEVGGAYNMTGTFDTSGTDGGAGGSDQGGSGGGSAGNQIVIYGSLTADSGTYTSAGGAGGDSADGDGANGVAGQAGAGGGGACGDGASSQSGGGGAASAQGNGGAGGDLSSGGSASGGAAGASMSALRLLNINLN